MFNKILANILKNKELNAIKSKLTRIIKTYGNVKKHNKKTGAERKDWVWYEKMDNIFGIRENILPSFIANRNTDIEEEESLNSESKLPKKLKKNNVDSITFAIIIMSETRKRVWEKKIKLEKEKLDKHHAIELNRLKVEKQKWEFEQERMKMEFEIKMKEIKFKINQNNSNNLN